MINLDILKFKDEILKNLREMEKKLTLKINKNKEDISLDINTLTDSINSIKENNNTIIESITEQRLNLDKILIIEKNMTKFESNLSSQEKRINDSITEISYIRDRCEKSFSDSLSVPGIIGKNCKFNSFNDYIINNAKEINKLKADKEYAKKEGKELKQKLDEKLKSFSGLVDSFISRSKLYTDSTKKSIIEFIDNKIIELDNKNLEFLAKFHGLENEYSDKFKSLNINLDNFNKYNNEQIVKIENKLMKLNKQIDDINENINNTKNEFEDFKNKEDLCWNEFYQFKNNFINSNINPLNNDYNNSKKMSIINNISENNNYNKENNNNAINGNNVSNIIKPKNLYDMQLVNNNNNSTNFEHLSQISNFENKNNSNTKNESTVNNSTKISPLNIENKNNISTTNINNNESNIILRPTKNIKFDLNKNQPLMNFSNNNINNAMTTLNDFHKKIRISNSEFLFHNDINNNKKSEKEKNDYIDLILDKKILDIKKLEKIDKMKLQKGNYPLIKDKLVNILNTVTPKINKKVGTNSPFKSKSLNKNNLIKNIGYKIDQETGAGCKVVKLSFEDEDIIPYNNNGLLTMATNRLFKRRLIKQNDSTSFDNIFSNIYRYQLNTKNKKFKSNRTLQAFYDDEFHQNQLLNSIDNNIKKDIYKNINIYDGYKCRKIKFNQLLNSE